jgi:aspartate kinase
MRIVQKYGGSSVGSLERIRAVAKRCLETAASGDHELLVVVSAMAGETDRLIGLSNRLLAGGEGRGEGEAGVNWVSAAKLGDPGHERELSQLISTGEKVSAALLAMAIQQQGGQAQSMVGHQLGLKTDRRFTNARIREIDVAELEKAFANGRVVVCAGFQGLDDEGNITTLGRGGSDTSAVALAAAVKADVCEILTDVDGVYTTDPRIVPSAKKLDRIAHEEMLELASLGAKVLQIRSVEFAMKYDVPLHVRSSLNHNEGTWIVAEDQDMESVVVRGVALDRNEAKVTLTNCPDVPGTVATVFETLGAADIIVDMIIQNASREGHTDVTFTVPKDQLERTRELLNGIELLEAPGVEIVTDPAICKISIVGVGMRTHAGVAARAFAALAKERINIQMVSTSEIKVSVVVEERYGELALRALHAGFNLDQVGSP